MGQALFVQNLVRAFRLVSGYDGFVAAPRRNGSKRPKSARRRPRV